MNTKTGTLERAMLSRKLASLAMDYERQACELAAEYLGSDSAVAFKRAIEIGDLAEAIAKRPHEIAWFDRVAI